MVATLGSGQAGAQAQLLSFWALAYEIYAQPVRRWSAPYTCVLLFSQSSNVIRKPE